MLITLDEIFMMPVRALSFKQPYASMMLHGKNETREWQTAYRGLVLICASQKPYNRNQKMTISGARQCRRMREILQSSDKDLINGHAIGIGRLRSCRLMASYAVKKTPAEIEQIEDKTFVRYFEDLWVFEFSDIRPINPIPWIGHQKWRELTREQKNLITLL